MPIHQDKLEELEKKNIVHKQNVLNTMNSLWTAYEQHSSVYEQEEMKQEVFRMFSEVIIFQSLLKQTANILFLALSLWNPPHLLLQDE